MSVIDAIKNYPLRQKAWMLIHDTPAEIVVSAALLMTVGGVAFDNYYRANNGLIPISFSEFGKTYKAYADKGLEAPVLTRMYSRSNDFAMKIFESANEAFERGNDHDDFARELETRIDPALRVYRQLPDMVPDLQKDSKEALQRISLLLNAARDAGTFIEPMQKSWEDDHDDVYKTVHYTETVCDADNKNCREEPRTRQEYDYTIHTYEYFPQYGNQGAQNLKAFLEKYPTLQITERLELAKKTDVFNEYAIERSMKKELKGQIPTPEQSLSYANTWATGSTFSAMHPVITSNHDQLLQKSPQWDKARLTARSDRYQTSSPSDSGPREFQLARGIVSDGRDIVTATYKISSGIQFMGNNAQVLVDKIKEYIGVVLDKKPGDADKLRTEIMDLTRTAYNMNFVNGHDVRPFKWEVVVGVVIGLGVIGGLKGWGLDEYFRRNRYRLPFGNGSDSGQRTPYSPYPSSYRPNGPLMEQRPRFMPKTGRKPVV